VARLYARIYLHTLAAVVLVSIASAVTFALVARGALQREWHEGMSRHLAGLVADALPSRDALVRRVAQLHTDLGLRVAVWDLDGVLLASAGRPPRAPSAEAIAAARADRVAAPPPPPWRALAPVRDPQSGRVVALVQIAGRRPGGWRWLARPALTVVLVLLLVGAATAPLARRISRPLEHLTEAARRFGGGDLSYRLPAPPQTRPSWRRATAPAGGRPDEISELTGAFNDMAGRVERLVQGQKALLANVSHELRSPLARIRVALALLPRTPTSEPRLDDLERDVEELERLIDEVLTGARIEATGLPARLGDVELRPVLAALVQRAAHDPATSSRALCLDPGPDVIVRGSEALLRRAVWNLIENAAKYGAPPIVLALGRDDGWAVITVTDAGHGIPVADRTRVMEPFYRGDAARTPSAGDEPSQGFGLGLSLARQIAMAHGGSLTLGPTVTADGRETGCRATLRIAIDPALLRA